MSRLNNIRLLARCYAHALFHSRPTKIPESFKTVFVLQTSKMGDMVCTTPMFTALKQHVPGVKVIVGGSAINRELLERHPHVDEYLPVSDLSSAEMTDLIKSAQVDVAICTEQDVTALAPLILSGVKCVIATKMGDGPAGIETRPYRLLRHLTLTVPYYMGQYFPRQYLRLLEPLGIHTQSAKKMLRHSKDAEDKVQQHLSDSAPNVLIATGAGYKVKAWPPDRMALIIRYVKKLLSANVILIGGPTDLEETTEVLEMLDDDSSVIDTTGKLSLDELKALVSRSDMLIAVDTGPVYIAEAYGVPTVDIIGPVDEREQPPHNDRTRLVYAKRDKPAIQLMTAKWVEYDKIREQVEAVSTDMVQEAVLDLSKHIGLIKK